MNGGHVVLFYWNEDKQFIQSIDGVETVLTPWLGLKMEDWNKNPPDWKRANFTKHVPDDLMNHLKKEEGRYPKGVE